jgi:hypothetical protein
MEKACDGYYTGSYKKPLYLFIVYGDEMVIIMEDIQIPLLIGSIIIYCAVVAGLRPFKVRVQVPHARSYWRFY